MKLIAFCFTMVLLISCNRGCGGHDQKEYILDANSPDLDLEWATVSKGRLQPKEGYVIDVSADSTEMILRLKNEPRPVTIIKSKCSCQSGNSTCHVARDAFYCVPDSACVGCKMELKIMI